MRARNIKPGFFSNPKLGKADPIMGWIFEGLWCMADPKGYLEDDEEKIHGEINRFRHEASTRLALDWLHAEKFIVRYSADGKRYIWIPEFEKHQHPHMREKRAQNIPVYQRDKHSTMPARGKPSASEHSAGTGQAPVQPVGLMIDDCGLMIIDPLTTGSTPVPDVCVKHAEPEPRSEPKPPSMADEASLAIRESVRAKIASSPKANGRRPPCSGDVRAQLVAEAAAAGSTAQILGLLTVHRTHLGKPGRHQGAQLEARLAQYTLEQQRAMLVAAIVQRKPDMQRIDLTESQP